VPSLTSRLRTPRDRARLTSLALILLFLVSLPAVTARLYASDEIQYFAYLRSVWFDHDLSFDNEYRYFHDRGIARVFGFEETFLQDTTPTGLRYNFGTVGCAILWMPFYAAADLTVRMMRLAGSSVAADGFSRPYLAAVAYGSAVYGFLAVLLSIRVARHLTGSGTLAGTTVWLGTPLLFYMYVAPGMAHACSAFAVALFVTTWLAARERWSPVGVAGLGAVAALMGMVREQDLFFAVGPALDFAWTVAREWRTGHGPVVRRQLVSAAAGLAGFAVAYLPQAMAYVTLNGRLGPPDYIASKMRWMAPYAPHVLLSPGHGLLIWTPLVLLCLVGLVAFALGRVTPSSGHRRLGTLLVLMFASQVYVSGSVDSWTVGGSFGQRRFVGTTVLLVVGLAALWRLVETRPRWLLGGAIAVCVWWNLALMAQFGAGTMDRQRLEPARNAYNSFVVVPRSLPRLAYRYVFDRSSFYQEPERYAEPRP
jgi:hypothetical protein